jgi:two-component system response regulator
MENRPGELMILLVEDNDNDASLMLRVLNKQSPSTTIRVARDGAEALDMLESQDTEPPQLILLDLHLPGISGLQVLQKLRENELTRHVPVVMISGSHSDADVGRSYDLGANSFLSKTGKPEQFEETVRQVIPYWLHLNHPYVQHGTAHR